MPGFGLVQAVGREARADRVHCATVGHSGAGASSCLETRVGARITTTREDVAPEQHKRHGCGDDHQQGDEPPDGEEANQTFSQASRPPV
ncbi:hypothetical protein KW794_01900 [Candidatus Saccharibacteria bacterium]|nr:hypothetical protein [Candidatus Saccharibacteria bacterium]